MRYEEILSGINSGDIIATTHTEWGSLDDLQVQAIRLFTLSEYSHVGVALKVEGEVFILEAVVPKVVATPLASKVKAGFYVIQTNTPMLDDEFNYGISQIGKGIYSKIQAIGGYLNTLDIGEDNYWQCAELVISMRRLSGLDLGPRATPSAVVQKALKQGLTLTYIQKDENV